MWGKGRKVKAKGEDPTYTPTQAVLTNALICSMYMGADQSCGECQPVEYFDLW